MRPIIGQKRTSVGRYCNVATGYFSVGTSEGEKACSTNSTIHWIIFVPGASTGDIACGDTVRTTYFSSAQTCSVIFWKW